MNICILPTGDAIEVIKHESGHVELRYVHATDGEDAAAPRQDLLR